MRKILIIIIAMILSLAKIDFKLINRNSLFKTDITIEIKEHNKSELLKLKYGSTIDDLLKIKKINIDHNFYPLNYILSDYEVINVNYKQSINQVMVDDLVKIPYISKDLAEKIIDFRNKNGKFKTVDDLKKIKGLGESKLKVLLKFLEI